MEKLEFNPEEIEFYMRKGRRERSLAAHSFLNRRYEMIKKYLSKPLVKKEKRTRLADQACFN